MTKKVIVSVFDSASRLFGQPIFVPAIPVATRSFTDEVNNKSNGSPMFDHPEDFVLYHLGYFDDESGLFESLHDNPVIVVRAKDVKENQS